MAEIGKTNNLQIVKFVEFGAYLDGGQDGEILLPGKYIPEDSKTGDFIDVFVYTDSSDRLIATTEIPFAEVGDIAPLQVSAVNDFGAFLNWGLVKDLLLPYSQQSRDLKQGDIVVVYIYLDNKSKRPVATCRWDSHADTSIDGLNPGDACDIVIAGRTKLGYKALVNKKHYGLIFHSDVFKPLSEGEQLKAYIKNIRPDGKLDLSLSPIGFMQKINGDEELVLSKIKEAGGFLNCTDKTPAEEIYAIFGISKRAYKQAVGALYKKQLISIETGGLRAIAE